MANGNRVVREGISAGLIGALAIAVWFAIVDLVRGEPLQTPIMLGTSIGSLFLGADDPPSRAGAFIGYTVFHFAIFALIGIVFAWVVNAAERVPSAFIGFAGLFVAFEVGWIGWTTVLSQGFGELSWLQVFAANLIGAAAMGWYMWKQHPALPGRVGRVLAGAPE
jgi:FtsH-binding integral membrane protein